MAFELPGRFSPEWISQRPWRSTPYSNLELCELGVLRRPKGSQLPGSLVCATPNKLFPPRYRITMLGGTKKKYVVDVEKMMEEIFGRFSNKNLLVYDYLRKMQVLCMEYNRRYFTREASTDSKLLDGTQSAMQKKRLCAGVNGKSCGRMIYDYRCPSCWILVRNGIDVGDEEITYNIGSKR